jgi:hypothetical protein
MYTVHKYSLLRTLDLKFIEYFITKEEQKRKNETRFSHFKEFFHPANFIALYRYMQLC